MTCRRPMIAVITRTAVFVSLLGNQTDTSPNMICFIFFFFLIENKQKLNEQPDFSDRARASRMRYERFSLLIY